MRVLLIDDDDLLLDLYVTKFIESGHTVDHASDAKQALAKLKDNEYDLVLSDLIMPGHTGIEMFEEVTKAGLKKKAKFVILSNQSIETYQSDVAKAGIDDYIIKAESIPSEVVKKAESIINGK